MADEIEPADAPNQTDAPTQDEKDSGWVGCMLWGIGVPLATLALLFLIVLGICSR